MRAPRLIPQYTVADYQTWEGDWELIDGIPWSMSPSPVRKHSRVMAELARYIGNEFEKLNQFCSQCEVVVELDWVVNDTTVVRPDIAITCNDQGKFISTPPVLVVEILSPSTTLKDKNLKFSIYESAGVPYYIIINPESAQYEIHILKDGKYTEANHAQAFELPEGCTLNLDLAKVLEVLA